MEKIFHHWDMKTIQRKQSNVCSKKTYNLNVSIRPLKETQTELEAQTDRNYKNVIGRLVTGTTNKDKALSIRPTGINTPEKSLAFRRN